MALFRGLRLKLTLWYGGVLAVSLITVGLVLYLTLQHYLLQPIRSDVSDRAQLMAQPEPGPFSHGGNPGSLASQCGNGGDQPGGGHSPPTGATPASPVLVYIACYTPQGNLLTAGSSQPGLPSFDVPTSFENPDLVKKALRVGTASDEVDGGTGVGTIYRTASVVRDPSGGSPIAVVQAGRSIQEQLNTLALVRLLLLALGGVSLVIATVGGSLLARRALVPAHLAFRRQRDFIADASHELRMPLTLLRADAEVLLRGRSRLAPDDAELLDDIVIETSRMDHLASHLLMLARLDAGVLHLEYDMIDLNDVVVQVGRRAASLAAEHDVRITSGRSSPVRVLGDQLALEQALMILVDNAIKYTPAGGTVAIEAGLDGQMAHLEVTDTGVGIDPEHLPRLSERFYRVDRARARESGGVGLGLSIAQGIARAHGGRLQISSQSGQGTTARLTIPASGPPR